MRKVHSYAPKARWDSRHSGRRSAGPFFSVLPEKGGFQPRFLSRMRKKAPLTVERKNRQGRVASEQTPHPSSCPPQAADRCRPFRCSSFSHTNRFAGFAWEPCSLCNPIKTTKEGDCGPFLGFSPEFGLRAAPRPATAGESSRFLPAAAGGGPPPAQPPRERTKPRLHCAGACGTLY